MKDFRWTLYLALIIAVSVWFYLFIAFTLKSWIGGW